MAVEILSRSGLRERELLLGQIARRNGKIARIHARARCHATAEQRRTPRRIANFIPAPSHTSAENGRQKRRSEGKSLTLLSMLVWSIWNFCSRCLPGSCKGSRKVGRTFKTVRGYPIRSPEVWFIL